jgi:hypothetical protein
MTETLVVAGVLLIGWALQAWRRRRDCRDPWHLSLWRSGRCPSCRRTPREAAERDGGNDWDDDWDIDRNRRSGSSPSPPDRSAPAEVDGPSNADAACDTDDSADGCDVDGDGGSWVESAIEAVGDGVEAVGDCIGAIGDGIDLISD